ncbi:MAG: hypothetical protein ACP5I8_04340 [Phycisphaerae bacterium]
MPARPRHNTAARLPNVPRHYARKIRILEGRFLAVKDRRRAVVISVAGSVPSAPSAPQYLADG